MSTIKFDLAAIDTVHASNTGMAMVIRDLYGEPLPNAKGDPMSITLLGPDSTQYRAATRTIADRQLAAMRDGKASIDDIEQTALDTLVNCSVEWSGILREDGKPVPFSREAVRALYVGFPVVREQAERFYGDRRNFVRASPKP